MSSQVFINANFMSIFLELIQGTRIFWLICLFVTMKQEGGIKVCQDLD